MLADTESFQAEPVNLDLNPITVECSVSRISVGGGGGVKIPTPP